MVRVVRVVTVWKMPLFLFYPLYANNNNNNPTTTKNQRFLQKKKAVFLVTHYFYGRMDYSMGQIFLIRLMVKRDRKRSRRSLMLALIDIQS